MKISPIQNSLLYQGNVRQQNTSHYFVRSNAVDTVSFGSTEQNSRIDDLSKLFKNPIKAVFSDIDGTILNKGKAPQSALDAITNIQDSGVPVILATGRSYRGVLPLIEYLGIQPDYIITQQGGSIVDKDGNEVYGTKLSQENSKKIIELSRNYQKKDPDTSLVLYCNGIAYSESNISCHQKHPHIKIEKIDSLDELLENGKFPTKALFIKNNSEKPSDMEAVKRYLQENMKYNGVVVFQSDTDLCEITNDDTSKGSAVKFLAEMLKMDLKNTACIGDAENDIEMMNVVRKNGGLTIAMGNAMPSLKAAAKFVTSDINENGYSKALNAIVENNAKLAALS